MFFYPNLGIRALRCALHRNAGFPFQMPYKLTFSCTYSCNSRCATCNIWKRYLRDPKNKDAEMTLDEIDGFFKKLGGSLLWLSLTGGEPFLRDDLPEIISSASRHCAHLSLVSLNTNGLETDRILSSVEKILSANKKKKIIVVVSHDSSKELYDRIRGVRGAYMSAQRTIDSLVLLQERFGNLRVGREITIGDYNVNSDLSVSAARSKEIPYATIFSFVDDADYYQLENKDSVTNDADYIPAIDKLIRANSIRTPEDIITRVFYKQARKYFLGRRDEMPPCYSSWASVFIDPYGNVKPCLKMESLGNIREHDMDLRQVLESEEFKSVRRKIRKGSCPGCWTPCEAFQTIAQNLPFHIADIIR